jgi:glycosyltransferase involved in cell wall biosynthesis
MSTRAVSVIIPAHNSESTLSICIEAVMASSYPVSEIIVVNDGSSDATSRLARSSGAATIDLDHAHGPNYCRNIGTAIASGEIVLFLDSDVVVQRDTIRRVVEAFTDERVDAIVGIYSSVHRHTNLVSQYKNLWIRFSYLRSGPRIDWIFGAISAIRGNVVRDVQGFDRHIPITHGGDDLELGKRLAKAAHTILIHPEIEVEHLHRHTLTSLWRNDFSRSQGFVVLAGRLGEMGHSVRRGFVNIYPAFVVSTALSWPILGSAVAGVLLPAVWWIPASLGVLYLGLNHRFLAYFVRHRGLLSLVPVVGILWADHLACALGSTWGIVRWMRSDWLQREANAEPMNVHAEANVD